MGMAKSLMMEMEDTQWEGTDVEFLCPNCGAEAGGFTELPVVYENGDEHHLPITIICHGCNAHLDGSVKTNWSECVITLDDYPSVEIIAQPMQGSESYQDDDRDYLEWLEWMEQQERESRPVYMALYKTITDIKALAAEVTSEQRPQMLARMLLAQSVTALEVFLADSLILTVATNEAAQVRLLRSNTLKIGEISFKLSDAIGIEDFAKTKLIEHLRAVSFHDLKKVAHLFNISLNFNIMPREDALQTIRTSISLRHDCVHRNGRDRTSGKIHEIDKASLLELADTILAMGLAIDEKVTAWGKEAAVSSEK